MQLNLPILKHTKLYSTLRIPEDFFEKRCSLTEAYVKRTGNDITRCLLKIAGKDRLSQSYARFDTRRQNGGDVFGFPAHPDMQRKGRGVNKKPPRY